MRPTNAKNQDDAAKRVSEHRPASLWGCVATAWGNGCWLKSLAVLCATGLVCWRVFARTAILMQFAEALVGRWVAPHENLVRVLSHVLGQARGEIHHLVSPMLLWRRIAAMRQFGRQPQHIACLECKCVTIGKRQHCVACIDTAKRVGAVAVHAVASVAVVGAAGFQLWPKWVVPKLDFGVGHGVCSVWGIMLIQVLQADTSGL